MIALRRVSHAALAALGLLLTTAGAASAGTVTTTTVPPAANAERHALLVLKDLPAGWTAAPASANDSSSVPSEKQLASCIGIPASQFASNSPHVDSPDFSSKDGSLGVSDSVDVYKSPSGAADDIGALRNSKTPRCMQSYLDSSTGRAAFEKATGATLGKVAVSRSSIPFPAGVASLELKMPLTAQGKTVNIQVILAVATKGNLEQTVTFDEIGSSGFPSSLARHLVSVAVARL